MSFDRGPLLPEENTLTVNTGTKKFGPGAGASILDPREFRPMHVRVSLEFHNIQAHLPIVSEIFLK